MRVGVRVVAVAVAEAVVVAEAEAEVYRRASSRSLRAVYMTPASKEPLL